MGPIQPVSPIVQCSIECNPTFPYHLLLLLLLLSHGDSSACHRVHHLMTLE